LDLLYHGLDPHSMAQALAFYELHPESNEGKEAIKRVGALLQLDAFETAGILTHAINRFSTQSVLAENEMEMIERLAAHLPNRKLKGYTAQSEKEVLALPPEEIDLGRALLLSQLDGQKDALLQVRNYSAIIDLMALQLQPRLNVATPEEKIKAINQFIFEENRFRFPPHSLYAKDIDLYTFLPSVMDNHLGVCLGVTTLYLALAQRVGLKLESVTPPGHIYLRYNDGEKKINIETTARGINIEDEHYLGLNVKSLLVRTMREVIGMTHVNKASIYLHQENFEKAAAAYEKAKPYLENDPMVQELLGLSLLFIERKDEGLALLKEAMKVPSNEKMLSDKLADDFVLGKVDTEGLKAIFMQVDEKRSSILAKQKRLEKVLESYPDFRAGLEQLGVCYLQLNRAKEALVHLTAYHKIDSENPAIEYYLSVIYAEREDFNKSWQFFKNAEKIVKAKGYYPKALKELHKELLAHYPEPAYIVD
jgi:tetratricopeptide (TPR) repeat protein